MGKARADVGEIWTGQPIQAPPFDPQNNRFLPPIGSAAGSDLVTAFGRALMAWNTTEGVLRVLLETIVQHEAPAGRATFLALSSDLGGMDLERVVWSLADAVLPSERKAQVVEVVNYIAAIRPYRNYYAHGLNHISVMGDEAVAPVLTWTAKRGIKHQTDQVTKGQLDELAGWCAIAANHIMALHDWWYPMKLPGYEPKEPVLPPAPAQLAKLTRPLRTYSYEAPARGARKVRK